MGVNDITLSVCRKTAWPFKSKECLDKVRVLRHSIGTPFLNKTLILCKKKSSYQL